MKKERLQHGGPQAGDHRGRRGGEGGPRGPDSEPDGAGGFGQTAPGRGHVRQGVGEPGYGPGWGAPGTAKLSLPPEVRGSEAARSWLENSNRGTWKSTVSEVAKEWDMT